MIIKRGSKLWNWAYWCELNLEGQNPQSIQARCTGYEYDAVGGRLVYIWENIPTSICPLFWRCVLWTPVCIFIIWPCIKVGTWVGAVGMGALRLADAGISRLAVHVDENKREKMHGFVDATADRVISVWDVIVTFIRDSKHKLCRRVDVVD